MLQSRMGVFLVTGVMVALLTACGAKAPESAVASPASADGAANPFLTPSPLPYGLPPFDQIEHAHFAPAFAAGMAEERAQVEAILANSEAPSFENTIVALEMTGSTLDRVSRVFYALSSAHTNDDIQALRADLAPERVSCGSLPGSLSHKIGFGRRGHYHSLTTSTLMHSCLTPPFSVNPRIYANAIAATRSSCGSI